MGKLMPTQRAIRLRTERQTTEPVDGKIESGVKEGNQIENVELHQKILVVVPARVMSRLSVR
ncbi:hypothetical protein DPMN_123438 [Dreissena polymorpha]|uniref:Uncharacterized protein n=1 Tax=Dreissena polymorpha TaxID=45954 RepID=A0A9D4GQC3_DREPO|nr:hypothetical protein DPMN_123438 [Dreissena polymorpha]